MWEGPGKCKEGWELGTAGGGRSPAWPAGEAPSFSHPVLICCFWGGRAGYGRGSVAWKTPHQVSPEGLGQDHLLLQLLLDVLSREDHSLGEEEQVREAA